MNDHKHTGADPYSDLAKGVEARKRNPALIVGGIVAVAVVVMLIIAVVINRDKGSDSGSTTTDPSSGLAAAENATQQTATVKVEGPALAAYPQTQGFVAPAADDPAVGTTPPTLIGQSFDQKPLTINPKDGRAKVVLFVAHWCPHCQVEVPLVQKWIDDGNLPKDVDVYGVSTAVTEERPNFPPSAWLASEKFTPKVLVDDANGTAAAAWALPGFPYFVMVDKDGKVVRRASGEVPIEEFSALVKSLSTPTTN